MKSESIPFYTVSLELEAGEKCESLGYFQAGFSLNFGCFRPHYLGLRIVNQQSLCDSGNGDTDISGSLEDIVICNYVICNISHHGHYTCGAFFGMEVLMACPAEK